MLRKNFVFFLVLFFFCLILGKAEAGNSFKPIPIKVNFNDGTVIEDINLILIKGMGFISVNDVSKIFNTTISWHSVSKKASITLGTNKIEFFVNSKKVVINGKTDKMGKTTKFIEGTIIVPLEFFLTKSFGEVISGKVNWDYEKRILSIYKSHNIIQTRSYTYTKYTRVVIDTTEELKYNIVKDSPNRLLVTIYHGVFKNDDCSIKINDGRVKDTVAQQDKRAVQLVISLEKLAENYKDFQLENPFRIVIDIKGGEVKTPSQSSVVAKNEDSLKNKRESIPKVSRKIISSEPASSEVKIKTIVIDAGHGGKDPGAIGRRGTKEKDICLDIAKRLARMVKEKTDIKVILTRKGDYFLTLAERTRIANANKADLFISIHANGSISRKLNGFEIYFLSDKASDKEAESVANIENSVMNLEPDREKDNLSIILWSMTLNEFMNESSEICSLIAKQVPKIVGIKNRGVKQAGFYVLRGAKMPAILVETAFITNTQEENNLKTRGFREKMAQSIFEGLMEYKKKVERKGQ